MPLLDHFHHPMKSLLQWGSMHIEWMSALSNSFNAALPPKFYAEPGAHFGIEVDVASLERFGDPAQNGDYGDWRPEWDAPTATATLPYAVATDELETLIYEDASGGIRLVGAVEFISPANKDRLETRRAFVAKCHGYLQHGVGVILIDVVTDKHFNLHNDLMDFLGHPARRMAETVYVTAYRTTGKNGSGKLETWEHPLTVGQALPTVPMWLLGGFCIPARLEETYTETLRRLRVPQRLADHAAAVQRRTAP